MNSELGVLPKPIPFGKYCLLEKISVGGMAEVYKAKAFGVEGFERLLAVKKILNAIAEDETFISMFIDEAKIAGQLNHPNICSIFDLGKVDGSYFIALEYISGKDMRTVWDRMVRDGTTPDVFMASHMVMKVCEALQYAHTKRNAAGEELHIVHRDISPHNVLISYEGEAKIIDFGIAKAQGKSSQTQVGILKGKFSYMSPEQVRGLHIDHRADLFSLGIVLYELLTLQRLFLGESDFDTLEKIRKVEMSPPTLYNPHIPRELEDIVLKSLAKSPDDRFQTGAELHDALQRFMRNQSAYFDQKDLSGFMKETFAADIELERKKLDYYRTINIDSLNGKTDGGVLSWEAEELETHIFTRQATPPDHDEINPAAERGAFAFDGDAAFSEPAFVGTSSGAFAAPDNTPVADIVYKSGEFQSQEFAQVVDAEDDPTMEFDRMRVIQSINPEIVEAVSPQPDLLDAALEKSSMPPPLPATVPMPPIPSGNPTFTGPAASETMPPGMVVDRPHDKKGSSALGIFLAFFIVLLLLAGLAASAVVFYPKFMPANTGAITFKITPAKSAAITIDDKVEYEGSTKGGVALKDIHAGDRTITVTSDGYETLTDKLTVEAGQNYVLPISLDRAKAKSDDTGFALKVSPEGVSVSLNGEELDDKAPFAKKDLEPGKYTLVFKKQSFLEETREIEIVAGELLDIDVTLKPALVDLTINPEPGDSDVVVYEKADPDAKARKRVKASKGKVELRGLDATKVYEVEVSKRGYQAWSKIFIPDGEADKTLLASLTEKDKGTSGVDPAERERLQRMAEEARKRREKILSERNKPPKDDTVVVKIPKDTVVKDPPKDPPKDKGFGILNVSSKPAARVFIDGSDTGRYTPLLNYKIPAGKHRVILRNDEQGLRRVYNIDIKANATKSLLNLPR